MNEEKVEIELRDGLVFAVMPDGTEHEVGTYEYLARVAHGEFNED